MFLKSRLIAQLILSIPGKMLRCALVGARLLGSQRSTNAGRGLRGGGDENVWRIASWIARAMLSLAHLSKTRPLHS